MPMTSPTGRWVAGVVLVLSVAAGGVGLGKTLFENPVLDRIDTTIGKVNETTDILQAQAQNTACARVITEFFFNDPILRLIAADTPAERQAVAATIDPDTSYVERIQQECPKVPGVRLPDIPTTTTIPATAPPATPTEGTQP